MFAKGLLGFFALAIFFACEDEINLTGSGIVNEVNFETNMASDFSVVSYTRNYPEGVQTNGAPVGVIGIYDDPIYGKTTASFLSQVTLSRFNPNFGDNPVVTKVILTLPYFSSVTGSEDGNDTFELDSVFANTGPVKLSLYRSYFFLNDLDPDTGFEEASIYLSNDISNPNGAINESLVEGELLSVVRDDTVNQNVEELMKLNEFQPTPVPIVLTEPETDEDGNVLVDGSLIETERLAPSLRVELDTKYWQDAIINEEGNNVLLNPNSFNDYFRGIYFKVEAINDQEGNMTFFNLTNANITINYTFEGTDDSGEPGDLNNDGEGSIALNFSGLNVVDYKNDFNPEIENALNTADEVNGEDNLYLKGGDGSIAIIDLFGPRIDVGESQDFQSELEILRSCGIIINEANLIFYVDQEDALLGLGELEPERLFIYDIDNNRTILDGALDNSIGVLGEVDSRTNHLGRLERSEEGDITSPGLSYRIRLTQHLNNIIKNDSTNVRLAIAVSQNVLFDNTALIAGTGDLENGSRVPVSSVISPEGTILHGNLSTNEAKRLRLRLSYTLTEDIDPNSPCGQLLGIE